MMIVALFLSDSTIMRFLWCLKKLMVSLDILINFLSVWFSVLFFWVSNFILCPIFLASASCSNWWILRMVLVWSIMLMSCCFWGRMNLGPREMMSFTSLGMGVVVRIIAAFSIISILPLASV